MEFGICHKTVLSHLHRKKLDALPLHKLSLELIDRINIYDVHWNRAVSETSHNNRRRKRSRMRDAESSQAFKPGWKPKNVLQSYSWWAIPCPAWFRLILKSTVDSSKDYARQLKKHSPNWLIGKVLFSIYSPRVSRAWLGTCCVPI